MKKQETVLKCLRGAAPLVLLAVMGVRASAQVDRVAPGQVGDQSSLNGTCGTTLTPDLVEVARHLQRLGAYDVPPSPEYALRVPMTFHIVRHSDGTGGLNRASADDNLDDANAQLAATGISFHRPGPIVFIDDDDFYNCDTDAEIDALRSTNPVAGTVNVYFTPFLASETLGNLCGISSFTFSPVQGIVMRNSCTAARFNHSTFSHEVGHYFDLYHTHETALGLECPDGSNCTVAGDLLCDTPADPNLSGQVDFSCEYTGDDEACGGQPYVPDPTNVMSYSTEDCRTVFTLEQAERALATLVNLRPALIDRPGLNVTWVDFDYVGGEDGSYAAPFNTLAEGVAATAASGTVVLKSATSSEVLTIGDAVTLDSFRGSSTIGQ